MDYKFLIGSTSDCSIDLNNNILVLGFSEILFMSIKVVLENLYERSVSHLIKSDCYWLYAFSIEYRVLMINN